MHGEQNFINFSDEERGLELWLGSSGMWARMEKVLLQQ